jgi:hypothetical protein
VPPVTLPYTLTNGTPADADQVMANYNALLAGVNDALAPTADDLAAALAVLLGVSQSGVTRRGYAAVATAQQCAAFGGVVEDLATSGPQVAVTVPTNGLVAVHAQATIAGGAGDVGRVHLAGGRR